MLKTNRFKTLLVLLATVLGLTGVTANVYADNATDRKTVGNMALTFSRYSAVPSGEALDWAEKNTTGKAFQDPYRHRLPGKDRSKLPLVVPQGVKVKLISVKVDRINKSAVAIVRRDQEYTDSVAGKVVMVYLQKNWFKLVDGKWKISDYYVLLAKATQNGKPYDPEKVNQQAGANPSQKSYDKIGTKFPY